MLLAEGERGFDLGLLTGERDQVGRIGKLAAEPAHDVAVGLAEGMAEPLVAVVAEQVAWRRLEARLGQLNRIRRNRLLRPSSEPELLADPARRPLEL